MNIIDKIRSKRKKVGIYIPQITEERPQISIHLAVKIAYQLMPEQFHATQLIERVRFITQKAPFDSSILRILRYHRQTRPLTYNWVCIDKKTALYKKLPFNN